MQAANVYSQFTISGIPAGTYILRVASHQTSNAEWNDTGRGYEKKSTNVLQIGGYNDTELRIEITQNGTATINGSPVTVSSGTITIGVTDIADLTGIEQVGGSTAITGYLTDCDISPTPTTYSGLLADTRIEKAWVHFTNAVGGYNAIPNSYTVSSYWGSDASPTDHSGS